MKISWKYFRSIQFKRKQLPLIQFNEKDNHFVTNVQNSRKRTRKQNCALQFEFGFFLLLDASRETPKEEHFFLFFCCLAWELADVTMDSLGCVSFCYIGQGIMEAFLLVQGNPKYNDIIICLSWHAIWPFVMK